MPGENGGELAGFLGEMLMGGLEALAEGREGRGERRERRPAGLEALEQMAAQRMNEGMLRQISERAAAATAAAAQRLAEVASPPMQASPLAQNSAAAGARIRSFAEGERIRSFAESARIRSFAEGERALPI
ncbi:MAG TPA: hypothetical protein VFU69_12300 [Ktedonobacterales bacterium]|nr:hypothetical protein [Ktedonobacterales bacterium]